MYNEDNIKLELDNIKAIKKENSASENFKDFYQKNKFYINACYSYYAEYESKKEQYLKPMLYNDLDNFKKELVGKTILVLTANLIEEGILLHGLVDAVNEKLAFHLLNDNVYHV